MAPEQVTGEAVTPRADVYGGAIILWELLTKRKAFQRGALPEVEVLRQMAEPRIPSLDTVRPDLDKTIRDAVKVALDPRHREARDHGERNVVRPPRRRLSGRRSSETPGLARARSSRAQDVG